MKAKLFMVWRSTIAHDEFVKTKKSSLSVFVCFGGWLSQ